MALILKNFKFVCQVFNFEELNKVINLKILFDNLSIKHIRFRTRYHSDPRPLRLIGSIFAITNTHLAGIAVSQGFHWTEY